MKKAISRRDFLKYLGVGATGTVLFEGASAASALAKENLPDFKLGPFKLTGKLLNLPVKQKVTSGLPTGFLKLSARNTGPAVNPPLLF